MLFDACQEGKHTPRLMEVKCPRCGTYLEIFVKMGSQMTGTLVADERCACGYLLPMGSFAEDYEE